MRIDRAFITRTCLVFSCVLLVLCVMEVAAFASDGADLPWNTGLDKLTKALSGKTALFISMIGIFFAGGMLIFGGDLGNFGKSIMMVVLVGCVLGGLTAVTNAFITTGAVLP